MKRIWVAIVSALLAVLSVSSAAGATALPDSTPQLLSVKVYRNLLETDDRLVVAYFNLPYATLPTDPASETFIWQFIDGDGTTVLGSTVGYSYVNDGYGYQVVSFYFGANATLEWIPDDSYSLRLIGNPMHFSPPPVYNWQITAGEYTTLSASEDVKAELASDILAIAEQLDGEWGLSISLISEEETGSVLSTFGQAYFRGAIYSIQSLAPALFPLAVRNITPENRQWDESYANALHNQYSGTWVETARAAGGELFGLNYDLGTLILVLGMVVGVVVAGIMITGSHWVGLMDAALVLTVAARLDLIGLGYVILMAAVCLIYMAIRLWSAIRG